MTLKNTENNYGSVAKFLHWAIAGLFLAAYIAVYYRHWFTEEKTPENWIALQLHLSVGVSIAVVVALRIIWRITTRLPDNEPGTRLAHIAAQVGQRNEYLAGIGDEIAVFGIAQSARGLRQRRRVFTRCQGERLFLGEAIEAIQTVRQC